MTKVKGRKEKIAKNIAQHRDSNLNIDFNFDERDGQKITINFKERLSLAVFFLKLEELIFSPKKRAYILLKINKLY